MDSLVGAFQVFMVLRYISAASFMALVFDHAITIDDEVRTIWINPTTRWHSKAAFVINRYLTEAIIAYVVYIFSGTATSLNTTVCQRFLWIYGVTCIVCGAISHFVILIRVYSLWDRRVGVARILTASFTVCITTVSVLGVFAVIEMKPELTYFEPFRTCVFGIQPKVTIGMLGVLSFFDSFLVALVIFNAMDRPRHTHIEIVSGLQTDGAGFFLAMCVLRFADLMVSIYAPQPAEVFMAITTVWGVCAIINARLHMRLEGLSRSKSQGDVIMMQDLWDLE
ncbi:hypothetical protein C8R43DRAFT_1051928 [Mycena crocata]|nr:hypothetical protein C8R43DRAFT_1051928 [Mycena crocata]